MTPDNPLTVRHIDEDTTAIGLYAPLPGLGLLPVQAFVVRGAQPLLVDTGPVGVQVDFLRALESQIDPADLRWIWLTHADADHVGNLRAVLERAPHARVITNYLGAGKMGLQQLPVERVHMLHAGQSLGLGDRTLHALRVPAYDAPETMGFFDDRRRNLFSSDCFGALMPAPQAVAEEMPADELEEGLQLWATIDAPWLHDVPRDRLAAAIASLAALHPRMLLSSHLPPAGRHAQLQVFRALLDAGRRPLFSAPAMAGAA
jgi:glyoxylase-like metal-dependent hydrolase (beta-lactamase superfamily II)